MPEIDPPTALGQRSDSAVYDVSTVDTLVAYVKGLVATAGDPLGFEQTVPVAVNKVQVLDATAANKDFITANTRGGQGLFMTTDSRMAKAFLLIIGSVVNTYAGSNALDCTTATHNQWQMALNAGAYADLVNGAFTDGQMLDNDWRLPVQGASEGFTLMFDITSQLTDVDGTIGLRLADGRAEQASLEVTISVYLKVFWKVGS